MTNLKKAGVLTLFLLVGCTTLTVQTDYETTYDFSTLKTYAWLEGKPPSNDIHINNSLIIDIADRRSKQLIWRGTGQDYIDKNETPEQITESINQTVAEILKTFPPMF